MKLILRGSEATEWLGRALAAAFPGAAAAAAVMFLHGELGAGKTTCVRSLLHALGVQGPVRSPTYTLMEPYAVAGMTCVHIDLYRLRRPDELEDLGLREYLVPAHLLLIEWPLNGAARFIHPDLEITLSYVDLGREALLVGQSAVGERWLHNLALDTRIGSYLIK